MNLKFEKYFSKWWFYHVVFWVSMLLSYFVDVIEYFHLDIVAFSISILIRICLLAILIYGNIYVLINFVYNRSKLLYWVSLIVMVILFSMTYKSIYFMTRGAPIAISANNRFILNILLAIRFLFISYLFVFLKGWFDQQQKINQYKVDKLATELNYLRAQINPHFLFNTLNNLYGLALRKSDKAPEVILKLSDIMDYMIYESTDAKVPLEKDVRNLVNYLDIERIRQGNNAKIDFTITGQTGNKRIIPLLLLPILENAFKHGVNKMPKDAFLDASLAILNDHIEFKVINSKQRNNDVESDDHGIGLSNLRKRLELFYENKHDIKIVNDPKTFSVELKIILE